MFDAASDQADEAGFEARGRGDRHHFRFIVSPDDAADMVDLRAFARDLMRQMEADLSTRLEWIAVDHWNTDSPHIHVLVRGVEETGADLVISRNHISRGLRSRAEDLVALELGPKPEHEIRNALEKEISADRWTRLDREIRMAADEVGAIDLRQDAPGLPDRQVVGLMRGRLQYLERLGLATGAGPDEWMVELGAERHRVAAWSQARSRPLVQSGGIHACDQDPVGPSPCRRLDRAARDLGRDRMDGLAACISAATRAAVVPPCGMAGLLAAGVLLVVVRL